MYLIGIIFLIDSGYRYKKEAGTSQKSGRQQSVCAFSLVVATAILAELLNVPLRILHGIARNKGILFLVC